MFQRNNFSKPGGRSSAYSSECRSDLFVFYWGEGLGFQIFSTWNPNMPYAITVHGIRSVRLWRGCET